MFLRILIGGTAMCFLAACAAGPHQTADTELPAETTTTALPAWEVTGLRSVRFGMTEDALRAALQRDFSIPGDAVSRMVHPTQKTIILAVDAIDILPESGPARIFYVLGHESRRLIQVNILWGRPATLTPDASQLIDTANRLRTRLLQENYVKDSVLVNRFLQEDIVLVFRGVDTLGHGTELFLLDPQREGQPAHQEITLRLSFIADPQNPDIYRAVSSP